jgi:hypothetical protein
MASIRYTANNILYDIGRYFDDMGWVDDDDVVQGVVNWCALADLAD